MGWEQDLRNAISVNNFDCVVKMIKNSEEIRKNIGKSIWLTGENPIHFACRKGNVKILCLFLAHGADVNAISVDPLGNSTSLLFWAVYYNQPEIIRILIDNGADCTRKGKCINYQGTPLDVAKQIGRSEVLKVIETLCQSRVCSDLLLHESDPSMKNRIEEAKNLLAELDYIKTQKELLEKYMKTLELKEMKIRNDPYFMTVQEVQVLENDLENCLEKVEKKCSLCFQTFDKSLEASCILCHEKMCSKCSEEVQVCCHCVFDKNLA